MKVMSDFVLAFVTAVGSSVDDQTKTTRATTTGIGGFSIDLNGNPITELGDEDGELGDDQETYGALGVLARPPDPETIGGKDYRAEGIAVRTEDGLVPFAWRDLRLDRHFPNGIPKGSVRVVGYGGAFTALDSEGEGVDRVDTETFYVPFDWNPATETYDKAHAIIIQPNAEDGITLTHADGFQVALTDDGVLMRTPDDTTFIQMRAGEITFSAVKIFAKGTLYVGQSAELGVPLLAGAASPPCPSLFLSSD